MDKKMPWNEKLESRYYFTDSELVCNVSTLSQLSLGLAIYIVYSLFSRQMINALTGIGLGVISTYFLVCVLMAYKDNKTKITIDQDVVTIKSMYCIKPKTIPCESIVDVEVFEKRRKRVLRFATEKKCFNVPVYKW